MYFHLAFLWITLTQSLVFTDEQRSASVDKTWISLTSQSNCRVDSSASQNVGSPWGHVPQSRSSGQSWTVSKNKHTINQNTKLFRRVVGRSRSRSPNRVQETQDTAGRSRSRSPDRVREAQNVAIQSETTDLYIVPYYRGNRRSDNAQLPFHWSIFAANDPAGQGTVYQLRGVPGKFRYVGPERSITVSHSNRKRQEMKIGKIRTDHVTDMEAIINQTPISTASSGYNCQNWIEDVLERMHPHSWLDFSPSSIVTLLRRMED